MTFWRIGINIIHGWNHKRHTFTQVTICLPIVYYVISGRECIELVKISNFSKIWVSQFCKFIHQYMNFNSRTLQNNVVALKETFPTSYYVLHLKVIWPFLLNVLIVGNWALSFICDHSFDHNLYFRFLNMM